MAKKVKSDEYFIFNDIILYHIISIIDKIVQQSGGYYNSIFYTVGVCGMER